MSKGRFSHVVVQIIFYGEVYVLYSPVTLSGSSPNKGHFVFDRSS